MTTVDYSLEKPDGENVFKHIKSTSSKNPYCNLYNYIKHVAQELGQEQSFYILDFGDILWKIQLWKERFPNITPFYAVKANADPLLIRLFSLLGFSFDCSTKGEINLVLENGGHPQKIIYAHTVKPQTSLMYASKVGVDFMTFDSEQELYKIQNHFPDARLIMRLKPDSSFDSYYDLSIKYGCTVLEAERLLLIARDLNLQVVGLSFHVGALCNDPISFTKTIHNCRLVWNAALHLGFQFRFLNMGAGFFGSTQKEKYFDVVATEIKSALKQYFPENNIQFIAEPGCYFVCSAQRNITCVIGKKTASKRNSFVNGNHNDSNRIEDNAIQMYYYINDGYYGSFFNHTKLYDIMPKPLIDLQDLKKRPVYKTKIWGQTCCSEDVIEEEYFLPEMKDGEYLVWENMGAYAQGVCSTFTMVPLPAPKRVFIKNTRLNLDWIENFEEIVDFLAENVDLIESENLNPKS